MQLMFGLDRSQPVVRRGICAALLVIVAVQMLGGMALASPCADPCADDGPGAGCPPVCALCTSCTHGQMAVVQHGAAVRPLLVAQEFVPMRRLSVSSQLASEIFHVPLPG